MAFASRRADRNLSRPSAPKEGVISAVQAQRKRRGRVSVYIDEKFAFSLSLLTAESAGLKPGLQLTGGQVEDLLSRDLSQQALDSALRYLSFRPRSEKEVRRNLVQKGFAEAFVEKAIVRLKELQLIDDSAFARFWVQERETHSPRSQRALQFELRMKGVDREAMAEAIEETGDQEASATAAAQKKLRSLRHLEQQEFRQKLGAFLARRGFDYETIKRVADTLWHAEQEGRGGRARDDIEEFE